MTNDITPIQKFWNAVTAKDYETVRIAIANGIDVNARIPGKATAPITFAQTVRDMPMLKILWEAGVQPVTPWLEDVFADFEAGGDGSKFKPKKVQPVGKFVLHRFNGDEEFALERASIRITHDKNGDWLMLTAITNGTVIKSLPDTEELRGQPKASISVDISRSDPTNLVGLKLSVPISYDKLIGDDRANFYYLDHESLDENEIEILAIKENKYLVKWIAQTLDVNYYDGSKPKTHIDIEGWFTMESDD